MRNATKKIAEKFKSELENEDIEVYIFNADKSTKEDILASIKESDSILFGTSTKYGNITVNKKIIFSKEISFR